MNKTRLFVAALAALLPGIAQAGVIIAPTSATINAGGPGFGAIEDTFNQAGLLSTYTAGVTDFDTYLNTNPLHSLIFSGQEWFSNQPSTEATVTYDLGSSVVIDALALWNEEASGIGLLNILVSSDDVTFTALFSAVALTDSPQSQNYPASVFSFTALSTRYVRLEMSQCPQPDGTGFDACAIGEIAFRSGQLSSSSGGNDVPEPASLALLGAGLAGLAASRRRKRS